MMGHVFVYFDEASLVNCLRLPVNPADSTIVAKFSYSVSRSCIGRPAQPGRSGGG